MTYSRGIYTLPPHPKEQLSFPISDKVNGKMVYHSCVDCGKIRLVRLRKGKPMNVLCLSCSKRRHLSSVDYFPHNKGDKSYSWKGGRHKTSHGYINIRVYEDNPYYSMANKTHHIYEHRLIMAQHLGRCLEKWEVVHHINGIKDDNRIENLSIIGHETHNMELNKEVKTLRWRIIQLEEKCRGLEEELKSIKRSEIGIS